MGINRNDFEFDDFDDDNSFNFGDDDGLNLDDDEPGFDFGDEPASLGEGGNDAGFGFEEEDMPVLEEEGEGGGFNRNFIILAAVMIGLFVVGLIVVVILALRPQPVTPNQLTATAIVLTNNAVGVLMADTQTAQPTINAAMTLTAQVTPTFTREPTFTPTPTDTPPPTLDATEQAFNQQLTQTVIAITQTAEFLLVTPTMQQPDQNSVGLTATALVTQLQPPAQETPGIGGGPTQEFFTPIGGGINPLPTALPDTGLFDDLGGTGSMGLIALLGIGLVAIIVVSRRARAAMSR